MIEWLAAIARPCPVGVAEGRRTSVHGKRQAVAGVVDRVVVRVGPVDHPDEQAVLEREVLDLVRCREREAELIRPRLQGRVIPGVGTVLDEVVAVADLVSVPVLRLNPPTAVQPLSPDSRSSANSVVPPDFTTMSSRKALAR